MPDEVDDEDELLIPDDELSPLDVDDELEELEPVEGSDSQATSNANVLERMTRCPLNRTLGVRYTRISSSLFGWGAREDT